MSRTRTWLCFGLWAVFLTAVAGIGSAAMRLQRAHRDAAKITAKQPEIMLATNRYRTAIAAGRRAETILHTAQRARAERDYDRIVSSHPAILAAYERAIRARLRQTWDPLYRELKLSPQQIGQMEEALLRDAESELDLQTSSQAQGFAPNDPAAEELRRQRIEALEAMEAAILGPENYAAFSAVIRQAEARAMADRAAALEVTSTDAYTPGQMQQLTELIAQESPTYQAGGPVDWDSVNWPAVSTQAARFLSGPQLSALQTQIDGLRLGHLLQQYFSVSAP